LESSGGYYALLKRGDKQFRHSFNTKDRKLIHSPMTIPTREQFRRLVETIRESDGREFSQEMAAEGADLVQTTAQERACKQPAGSGAIPSSRTTISGTSLQPHASRPE
jgi:hypothetical protein